MSTYKRMAEAPNKADTSTTDRSNLSNYLSIDKKPRIKWEGSSQQLESFVKETLSLTGKWSSHFISDEISITFHNATQTLQIQGKKGNELKARLLEMTSENGDTCRLVVYNSTAKRFYTAKQHRMYR